MDVDGMSKQQQLFFPLQLFQSRMELKCQTKLQEVKIIYLLLSGASTLF